MQLLMKQFVAKSQHSKVEAAQASWDALSDEDKAEHPGRPTDITLP